MRYCLFHIFRYFNNAWQMAASFGWSVFKTNEIVFLEDRPDTMLYHIHSESLEICHFHVFAIFSNSSRRPSWTAQSHKFERTPFAGHSD